MIKRLKRKFIAICMLSAFIAIFFIVSTINIVNFYSLDSRSDSILSMLIENNGKLPPPDRPDKIKHKLNDFPREIMFETRYFSVILDNDNHPLGADTGNIFFISSQEAEQYAQKVASYDKASGTYNKLKYQIKQIEHYKIVIFLDCSRDYDTLKSFFITSMQISALALILIFVASVILSHYAVKPISESYSKQKKFITNASHEIKTPLTVISANIDIIEMSTGENKWINSTKSQIKRLTHLVNNLVSLSRMDENIPIEKKEFSLSQTVEAMSGNYDSIALETSKTLNSNIAEGISYKGNEMTISQLVGILLDNAFKYSDKNGVISIKLYKSSGSPVIEVYNTVDNISKGSHNEFFDRFYRKDESHNNHIKGYGIGLSLAKSIAESHKGKITAKSYDGKSIVFKVKL